MQRLEIRRTETNSYAIAVDGLIVAGLTIDESMGCIASALFSDRPLFVKTLGEFLDSSRRRNSTMFYGASFNTLLDMSNRTMPLAIE